MGRCSSVAAGRWFRFGGFALMSVALAWVATAPPAVAQEVPFEGVVVGGPAQVRAGAGPAYYLVGTLPGGTQVTVREVYYGWNRIDAPDGVFSFISKAMVDAQGDGSTGTVNQDGAKVKAASIDGAGPSYRNQLSLNRGDVVAIVGEDGSYYRITPPAGASVYLSPGTVRRVELAEAAATEIAAVAQAVEPAESAEVTESTTTTTTVTTTTLTTTAERAAAEDDGQVEIAKEVDLTQIDPNDMVPAGDTPEPPTAAPEPIRVEVTEPTPTVVVVTPDPEPAPEAAPEPQPEPQPAVVETQTTQVVITTTTTPDPEPAPVAATQPAETTAVTPVQPILPPVQTPAESDALRQVELAQLPLMELPVEQQPIDDMVAAYRAVDVAELTPADQDLLAFRLAVLEQNRQIASVLKGVMAAQRGTQTTSVVVTNDVRNASDYDAVGRLLASAVYNGNNLPLMFRLVEPSTGRSVAYVQPDAVGDTRALLGRVVGIIGPMAYDPVLKLNVVEVRDIEALNPAE
ncbi:MAG: SH3 domain-containing protein [Planctomycetota bacterium]